MPIDKLLQYYRQLAIIISSQFCCRSLFFSFSPSHFFVAVFPFSLLSVCLLCYSFSSSPSPSLSSSLLYCRISMRFAPIKWQMTTISCSGVGAVAREGRGRGSCAFVVNTRAGASCFTSHLAGISNCLPPGEPLIMWVTPKCMQHATCSSVWHAIKKQTIATAT